MKIIIETEYTRAEVEEKTILENYTEVERLVSLFKSAMLASGYVQETVDSIFNP